MAKTKKPMNIATAIADIDKDAAELAAFDESFAELAGELESNLAALETTEPSIDADIKDIEQKGQQELADDAIEAAKTLDQVIVGTE